jgi:DNA replication licensing factor MCM6
MKVEEKVTMYIDFTHLLHFRFEDSNFIDYVVNQYHRYETYMKKAVTQFMNDLGH